jgi:uncharacterized membrane protein
LRVNPFDLKTVLLAKHAQHVVLIHFPIALFMTAVAFDAIAHWTKRQALAEAAYYNLLIAAISTPVVVTTGILAWQFQLEGQKLRGILFLHLVLACASSGLIWLAYSAAFYRIPIFFLPAISTLTGNKTIFHELSTRGQGLIRHRFPLSFQVMPTL